MKILGIETSCDETAAAVVEDGTKVLSSIVASSVELHAKTGGIIPETAARKQLEYIIPVIEKSLLEAFTTPDTKNCSQQTSAQNLLKNEIDAIAVTVGPGLIGSLLVGIETAKTLSFILNKPLIPVNHIIAHSYGNFIKNYKNKLIKNNLPEFPALNLIVSGGHTELLLMKGHNNFKILGSTRDDAAGEAFDKIARILGLPYPGGPAISEAADKYFKGVRNPKLTLFPRPMIESKDFDFSFSGLKTAAKNYLKGKLNIDVERIAAEVQEAIVDCLIEKSLKACKENKAKSFLLSGGVAANKRLRQKFVQRNKVEKVDIVFHVPDVNYCTDNAVIVASRAFFNQNIISWKKLEANPQLTTEDL